MFGAKLFWKASLAGTCLASTNLAGHLVAADLCVRIKVLTNHEASVATYTSRDVWSLPHASILAVARGSNGLGRNLCNWTTHSCHRCSLISKFSRKEEMLAWLPASGSAPASMVTDIAAAMGAQEGRPMLMRRKLLALWLGRLTVADRMRWGSSSEDSRGRSIKDYKWLTKFEAHWFVISPCHGIQQR